MTWKALLAGNKKLAPPANAPAPPPADSISQRPPSPATIAQAATTAIGTTTTTGRRSTSPSLLAKSSGFFNPPKLPPSPRSLEKHRQDGSKAKENTSFAAATNIMPSTPLSVLTSSDQNRPDQQTSLEEKAPKETWVPPLSPPRSSNSSPERTTPKKFTNNSWSINEKSSPGDQPIAISPVKGTKAGGFAKGAKLDMQEVRLRLARDFIEGIDKIEEERRKDLSLRYIQTNPQDSQKGRIKVFVRKRPMFPAEKRLGDFDVVRIEADNPTSVSSVVVYNTLLQADLETQTVKPAIFGAAACFDEQSDSGDAVYQKSTKTLVEIAQSGGIATLCMFGQSGSGKTYTMSALTAFATRDIFTGLPFNYTVKITVVELCGHRCSDLMDDAASNVRVVDNKDGSVRFVNALSVPVATPEELLEKIVTSKRRIQVQANGTMDGFGRHVICRMTVVPPKDAPDSIRQGTLTLVDCAGKESRHDNRYCGSIEVDASLWALKECMRAKMSGARTSNTIPYGSSTLSRVLRESLEREDATFHVIATVSPKATDTEHTIETLSTVSHLLGGYVEDSYTVAPIFAKDEVSAQPKSWDKTKLCDWLVRKHLLKDITSVPNDITGRKIMTMTKLELKNAFYEGDDFQKADLLYRCLRAERDRVSRLELKRRIAIEKS